MPWDLTMCLACDIDELILVMLFCISGLSFNYCILTATDVCELCLRFDVDTLVGSSLNLLFLSVDCVGLASRNFMSYSLELKLYGFIAYAICCT